MRNISSTVLWRNGLCAPRNRNRLPVALTTVYSIGTCHHQPGWHKADNPELDCSRVAQHVPSRYAVENDFWIGFQELSGCTTCLGSTCEYDSTPWQQPNRGFDVVAGSRIALPTEDEEPGEFAFEAPKSLPPLHLARLMIHGLPMKTCSEEKTGHGLRMLHSYAAEKITKTLMSGHVRLVHMLAG